MSKKQKQTFYSGKAIREKNARYNVIFGERSNGKTYDVLYYALEDYFASGEQHTLGIIRRFEEDFIGANSMRTCYNSLMCNGDGVNVIERLSKYKYNGVEYYGGQYFLTQTDHETHKQKRTDKVIATAFALTSSIHYKGASFPTIKTILFDEFITRKFYLPDEFVTFQEVLATIIRSRDDVIIYMCGNTVNKYGCPYFAEMGLYRIKEMKQGEIDLYTYGESELLVAVEWSDAAPTGKPSDVYFAFDNPRLKMIKTGAWEMDIYPHCPVKYKPKDILFVYFIIYEEITLQCEIVNTDKELFTFIHRKTTPIQDTDTDIIFTPEYVPKVNYRRRLNTVTDNIGKKIWYFFQTEKVFYQDNEVGEIVRNYLMNSSRK